LSRSATAPSVTLTLPLHDALPIFKTEFGPFMYPAEIAPDGAFMAAVNGGCRRMGLPSPATFHSHGALDAGVFCFKGGESAMWGRSEEHTSELQSLTNLVCRLLLLQ